MPHVMSPRQPSSTSAIMITCPATEYSAAMSTTVSPVPHTAEHAVKTAAPRFPAAPSARETRQKRGADDYQREEAERERRARPHRLKVPFSLSHTAQMDTS